MCVWSQSYRRGIPGVPLDPLRAERILAFLLGEGLVRRRGISTPRHASVEHLLRVHPPEYLRQLERPREIGETLCVPLTEEQAREALELQRLHVGGTIQATRLALRTGDVVAHLGGGFHHASPARGAGFCLFNDVAVAIKRLRARGFSRPVLVIDLDIHDGNGTRAAFADDPTVHTFSIHNTDWDECDAVASTAIPLGTGVDDDTLMETLRAALPRVIRAHRPGLVIYNAGVDAAADDPLGDWQLTAAGLLARDRLVVEMLRKLGNRPPIAVVLGGGYGDNAWRYQARFLGWLASGRVLQPPDVLDAALERVRGLEPESGDTDTNWLDWSITAEEMDSGIRPLPGRPALLLGLWSQRQVVELLERHGLLEQVRAKGFPHAAVQVEASAGLGETVRIWDDARRRHLLMELRVGRDARTMPGFELLHVEWLLLQNPRARFHRDRRPLPGQHHPGLGVFAEAVGWLAFLCERAGLDGVGFRSAHYFIVALGRRRLVFVNPRDKARWQAVRRAVGHLPPGEASRAVAEGRARDPDTGQPPDWSEVAMVLPISRRLRAELGKHR